MSLLALGHDVHYRAYVEPPRDAEDARRKAHARAILRAFWFGAGPPCDCTEVYKAYLTEHPVSPSAPSP